jgi:hypothetical protein
MMNFILLLPLFLDFVRVVLIVVFKRNSQMRERRWRVGLVHIGNVIVPHGLHERFGHVSSPFDRRSV